ncbi:MAG TPA: PA14 domain-containing protein, partial [Candidatus Acidoferrum sp.]|nr:PA14 domain-containing protein [Candidatus Acidoferrum sp.]
VPTSLSVTSRVATLTINPIHFVAEPADTTLPLTQSGTFSGSAVSGSAPYSYQWYTNGVLDPSAATGNYPVGPVGTTDSGRTFRLVITDSTLISITSRVATLTVLEAPGRVGVSFTGRGDCAPACSTLLGSTIAGLLPQGNWNNIDNSADGTFGGLSPALKDGNGAATSVTLTYDANDSWNNDGPSGTSDEKLMNGISKANGANRQNVYTFNNVPAGLYDVLVYLNVNGDNRIGDISSAGVTYYYTSQHAFGGSFIQITNQNPAGPRDTGNYVKFRVLPNAANQIPISFINRGDADGIGISGFQLVSLPEQLAFSSQPADASRYLGQNVTFSAGVVFGVAPVVYQWYTNGFADTANGQSASYTLNGLTVADSRTVQLVVSDGASLSITSRVARLGVIENNNISLNFVGRNGGFPITPATNFAGVISLSNWNNNVASGEMPTSGDRLALADHLNNVTPVTVHWESTDGWDNNTTYPGPDGNYMMMKGEYKVTTGAAGYVSFGSLPPETSFDVYAYTAVNNGGSLPGNVRYAMWVTNQADNAAGTLSRTNYALEPDNYAGTFVLAENYNPAGPFPGGHYSRFTNVFSAANGSLFIGLRHITGGDGAGITGIQLIRRSDVAAAPLSLVSATLSQAPSPVFEGSPFTLSGLSASGIGPRSYQWQTNTANNLSGTWVNVPGANSATYTATPVFAQSGTQYRVIVANSAPSSLTSAPIAIQVVQDVTPPTLLSGLGGAYRNMVTLSFSEPMLLADATNAANYTITNSTGAPLAIAGTSISADGKTVNLATAPQTANEQYGVVITGVRDRALIPNTLVPNPTIATFTAYDLDFLPGQVVFRAYPTAGDTAIAQLTNHSSFPNSPDFFALINTMNSASVGGVYAASADPPAGRNNFGATIAGHFIPPTSGNWVFYLRSDDQGQLLLNPNGPNPNGAVQIAFESTCCRTLESIFSSPIPLIAGQAYYIEGRYKEGGGGDYVVVGARLEGDTTPVTAIPASQLALGSKLEITQDPVDLTLEEAHDGVFSVQARAIGIGGLFFQWQRSTDTSGTTFTNIPGANSSNYVVGPVHAADDGDISFRVLVTNAVVSLSRTSVLHVVQDVTAPRVLSASVDGALLNVFVNFSEGMNTNGDAGLSEPLSYTFVSGGTPLFLDYAATNITSSNVVLRLAPGQLLENTVYSVEVCCVSDANTNALNPAFFSASFRTPVRSRGLVKYEFYFDIGGSQDVNALLNAPSFPNSPSLTYYTNSLNFPGNSPIQDAPNMTNDYGLRMSGFFVPAVSGSHTFWIRNDDGARFSLSTDNTATNLVLLQSVACCNAVFASPVGVGGLVAGQQYYFEALLKQGNGDDYLTIAVNEPNSTATNAISAGYLLAAVDATNAPNAGIAVQPQSVTVEENRTATVSVTVTNTGGYPPFIQWQIDTGGGFGDFTGAVGESFTTLPLPLTANGTLFRAVISLPGLTLTSDAAQIFVNADTNAPAIISAASANGTQVGVRFSEQLDSTTAIDTNN